MRAIVAVAAAAAISLASLPAQAETSQECLKATFEIAQAAQEKSPSQDQLNALEAQISQIEDLCDENKFTEAADARAELKTMVEQL